MQALAIYGMPIRPAAVDYLLQPYVSGINSALVLKRLLNMYMVRKEEAPHEGGGVDRRYYLHPTDRQYALSQVPRGRPEDCDPSNERPRFTKIALFCRAADYFRRVRRQILQSLDDLSPQLAEIKLRIAAEDYAAAAQVLFEIDLEYLSHWGKNRDVIELHESLQSHLPAQLRKQSLRHLGRAKILVNDYSSAITCFESALVLVRNTSIPNLTEQAYCLAYLGWCQHWLGNNQLGIDLANQSLSFTDRVTENSREKLQSKMMANGTLGVCYFIAGQTTAALDHAQRAVEFARQIGDRQEENRYLGSSVGVFYGHLENFEMSVQLLLEALDIANQMLLNMDVKRRKLVMKFMIR